MTPTQEDDFRLTKAREFIADCQREENAARVDLAQKFERTKRAREKHDELFAQVQKREVARRMAANQRCA